MLFLPSATNLGIFCSVVSSQPAWPRRTGAAYVAVSVRWVPGSVRAEEHSTVPLRRCSHVTRTADLRSQGTCAAPPRCDGAACVFRCFINTHLHHLHHFRNTRVPPKDVFID